MVRAKPILIGMMMLLSVEPLATHGQSPPVLVEAIESGGKSPLLHRAYYTTPAGLEMIGPHGISPDAGRTWTAFTPTPDFSAGLPHGYRRESFPAVVDPSSGRIVTLYNALDTPGLDPNAVEPMIALEAYYLRYSVSIDAGRTFLFDEPIVQQGRTAENAFDGVYVGKNGIYFGDIGVAAIFTQSGALLVAASVGLLDENGKLTSPGGGFTYSDVLPILGRFGDDNRIVWTIGQRIEADPKRSARGMIEPTIAQMPDGRILMVMRGSNGGPKDGEFKIPSYRWFSVSKDEGKTWTKPLPWTYDTGQRFFSPSSMSTLVTMLSGRVFWVGNINQTNSRGNDNRWPLVLGEVDPATLKLIKSTVVIVDTLRPEDGGRVNISHVRALEDRQTGDLLLLVPRTTDDYATMTWTTYRYAASGAAGTN